MDLTKLIQLSGRTPSPETLLSSYLQVVYGQS